MTKNLTKNLTKSVIAKAYKGKPVRLYAIRSYGSTVDVASTLGADFLPVRREIVYKFNEKLFKQLCMAYNKNDTDRLNLLWNQAEPYFPEPKG